MSETAKQYRMWVLHQFRIPGWQSWVRPKTKKSDGALAKLLKDGNLEQDEYGMFRITPAGRKALEASHD